MVFVSYVEFHKNGTTPNKTQNDQERNQSKIPDENDTKTEEMEDGENESERNKDFEMKSEKNEPIFYEHLLDSSFYGFLIFHDILLHFPRLVVSKKSNSMMISFRLLGELVSSICH